MDYVLQFLIAFCITLTSETIALFLVVRSIFKINSAKIHDSMLVFCGIFVSGLTLPYLWFVLPSLIPNYYLYVFEGEAAVAIAEALLYAYLMKIGMKRAAVASILCNFISVML